MLDKIRRFAEAHNMFSMGDTVVCGLSGGADSVCLTAALIKLGSEIGFSVEAIHVNHCIRGDESNRDELFCYELCQKLGIKLTAVHCNVPQYAREYSLSLEEAARILRYKAFDVHSQGRIIATAHNADDNLETAVLNLTRGSGLKGITGIPPVRDNIIRPLLAVTRAEIEDFLRNEKLSYVIDSTNLSDNYTRNKIRHKVIPLLAEINPAVVRSFISSSDTLREENRFIENEVHNALAQCRRDNSLINLHDLPPLIRRRCIARLLSDNNIGYNRDLLLKCENIALNSGKINVSGDLFLVSDGSALDLKNIPHAQPHSTVSQPLIFGENCLFSGKCLIARIVDSSDMLCSIHGNSHDVYRLDYDKIKGKLTLRNRKHGDKIRLAGRSFTSSIKKIINEKIPSAERAQLHFIEDEEGTVFAEKIGVAQRTAVTDDTIRQLVITVASV